MNPHEPSQRQVLPPTDLLASHQLQVVLDGTEAYRPSPGIQDSHLSDLSMKQLHNTSAGIHLQGGQQNGVLGLRRTSSFGTIQGIPERKRLVRFASTRDLHGNDDKPSKALVSDGTPRLFEPATGSSFINPFSSDSGDDSSPRGSQSSEASSYLRPNAFAGHRDTLARISRWPDPNKSGDDELLSQRSNPSIPSSLHAFSGLRDTFDRTHFERRITPYLPHCIIDKMLCYLSSDDYLNLRLTCSQ